MEERREGLFSRFGTVAAGDRVRREEPGLLPVGLTGSGALAVVVQRFPSQEGSLSGLSHWEGASSESQSYSGR